MRHLGRLVKAVVSVVVLVVLLIGVPVALWVLAGSPVPDGLPSLDEVRSTLSSADYTGTVLLGTLKVVGWIAWATFAWATLTELVAQARHRSAPRLRGLGVQQQVAAALVTAILLGFAWQNVAGPSVSTAFAAPTAPVVATVTVDTPAATVVDHRLAAVPDVDQALPGPAATTTHTVGKGETLWGLAEQYLGDGTRWKEIYDLNADREMPGGYTLSDPGWLDPGWELLIPDVPADTPTAPGHAHTVQPGDTLSQIAADELGDANRYPEIFAASTSTVQPDGRQLTDPDLIHPGWQMTVPGTAVPNTTSAQPQTADYPTEQNAEEASPTQPDATGMGAEAADESAQDAGAALPRQQTAPGETSPERTGSAASQADDGAQHGGVPEWAPWVLAGLTGAGAVLAGSLWLTLRARRRAQWRHRRPGRTLAAPGPLLAPVEKTVVTVGPGTAETVEYLDAVLRRLGAVVATRGGAMPDLVAVELTGTHVVLHLGAPWQLGVPWEGADDDHRWQVPVGLDLDQVGPDGDHPAPYPLLVTVGSSQDGSVWLFNMEDLAVTLTGDPERARDFGRYLVAEIGCSPWAAWATVDCVGMGAELVGLNPDRIRYHDPWSADDPVGNVLAEAMTTVARATAVGADVVTARSEQAGAMSWSPQVVLVDATSDDPSLDPLLDLVQNHAGQTGTSVVVAGTRPETGGVHIEVSADGRVRLPEVGLDLVAVGLDITEAAGCAGLVAHTETALDPVAVPYHDDLVLALDGTVELGWRSWTDQAGALRPEHTVSRDTWYDPQEVSSLLPADDGTYVQTAATTPDELALLGPQVPTHVRTEVEAADLTLDEDLAAWFAPSTTRPRVRVLGPVQVAATGTPPTRRQAFFVELVAYLALHPAGATPGQVAEAFSTSRNKAREYLRAVWAWLGSDPFTGAPYLSESGDDQVCQVEALVDLDLLRRLRVRGQARGAEGTDDLTAALRLVVGRPFDDPDRWRLGGWAWLVEDRTDETAMVAVVDTAHTIVTHALATADLPTARWAAETAQAADPYDEVIRLDLAAIASAEGRYAEAVRIVADEIGNRSDDGHAPLEVSTRTQQVVAAHPAWRTTRAS